MLHQHFVANGQFDEKHAAFFSRLMQERIDDDYSDYMIIDETEVRDFINPAGEYLIYIDVLINAYFSGLEHQNS